VPMFLKKIIKKDKQGNKNYIYYRLCESYRIDNSVRHRTLGSLGTLDGLSDVERKQLADLIEANLINQPSLFSDAYSDKINTLAKKFSTELREKLQTEVSFQPTSTLIQECIEPDFITVDANSIQHQDVREIGAEWLCFQTLNELGLDTFLQSEGWNENKIELALTQIISKAVFPASELKTSQWINDNSAVKELFTTLPKTMNLNNMYKMNNFLYNNKEKIEPYLSKKTNELFDLQDKIILYDLTNTYFEGQKINSKKAKFGRSKEKRSDAKLLSLALVVNVEGFIKYSKIYSGNISEPSTLLETIESLSQATSFSRRKPFVVMDAGISTEDNLKKLKENDYDYLCVSRSKLKDYIVSNDNQPIKVFDNKKQLIEIQTIEKQGESDSFLHVKSHAKARKEASMDAHFSERFEQELNNIATSIHKKGCTKNATKIGERIGRIKERYPSANKHYTIEIKLDKNNLNAIEILWKRKELTISQADGVYFIRTSVKSIDATKMWEIYNTLTQIEATFRILKTDLSLRPVFHQKDNSCEAHIYLGILAYTVVATIRYRLKNAKINLDWRNIVRTMNTQKLVTTTMLTKEKESITIKKCSVPSINATAIYKAMNYKLYPFKMKKFVFPHKS